jgi:peptidoglycan/LPS O-acetylase OafA/YrhL
MNNSSRIYFPSLNGIRAIAAFLVIWFHIEKEKSYIDVFNLAEFPFVEKLGATGVTLFLC